MLCNLIEDGRKKCENYWDNEILTRAGIEINVEEKKVMNNVNIRNLVFKKGDLVHKVTQIQYYGWPDHGVPKMEEDFKTFLWMINFVVEEKSRNSFPIVVHCSAG